MSVTGVSASTGTTSSSTSPPVVAKADTGFNGLTSNDFLKLLITQLQNQDPTQPMSNQELLSQLSSMRSLQSNIELSDTLKAFSNDQQLASGASFLGKTITGTDASKSVVNGIADRVVIQNGATILGVGTSQVPLANVTGVNLATN